MMNALAVGLLGAGVAGAVVRPGPVPTWSLPLAAALAATAFGLITPTDARDALDALAEPLAFLLAAIPLAMLLDQIGFFSGLAARLVAGGHGSGRLWILAAAVTTVLNLDAAVVLLTPLYVNIARHTGRDPLTVAFQPVLLACLASSALPVSNLTNLIAVEHTSAQTEAFVANLALPSLVATTVGWLCYRRLLHPDRVIPGIISHTAAPAGHPHALTVGGLVLGVVAVGFVGGPTYHVHPWMVALAADVVLLVLIRRAPWEHIPYATAITASSLAVLAAAAVADAPVDTLLGGTSTASLARTIAMSAAAANLVNNLPALLLALPGIGDRATPTLWATLIGVNMGPVVLATGSLASLLWLDALGRLGVPVHPRDFTRVGLRVGLPAALAGAVTFLALTAT